MKGNRARLAKLQRIARGGTPRLLDLFAGCGGISLGFEAAGFKVVGGIEIDPLAAESHAKNFFGRDQEAFEIHRHAVDITVTPPQEYVSHARLGKDVSGAVDVLAGGPPCQAYSIVGRAKLRDVKKDPEAFKNDERGSLYLHYMEYVEALQPLAVFIENVPEILRYGTKNVAETICGHLVELGYVPRYTILNAVHYGVPQLRDRMCLIAFAEELGIVPEFPVPTHHFVLPRGYMNLRGDVTRKLSANLLGEVSSYFVPPSQNERDGAPAVTAHEAIGDIPPITSHLNGGSKRGARRFTSLVPYDRNARLSAYVVQMKTWPGHAAGEGIWDHVIRHLPRDYQIFARMKPGDEYPAAHKVASAIFEAKLAELDSEGRKFAEGTAEYDALKKSIVPPYDPSKFANKWRKIDANQPVRTITAHIGKDSYSHIHYSDAQARTISVREAARLQSFPDGFVFAGTLDPALKQIGNSVPPVFARALGQTIMTRLLANAHPIERRA